MSYIDEMSMSSVKDGLILKRSTVDMRDTTIVGPLKENSDYIRFVFYLFIY